VSVDQFLEFQSMAV